MTETIKFKDTTNVQSTTLLLKRTRVQITEAVYVYKISIIKDGLIMDIKLATLSEEQALKDFDIIYTIINTMR